MKEFIKNVMNNNVLLFKFKLTFFTHQHKIVCLALFKITGSYHRQYFKQLEDVFFKIIRILKNQLDIFINTAKWTRPFQANANIL